MSGNYLSDALRKGKELGLSVARGVPQMATGLVDILGVPLTATGLAKSEDVFGSTDYLTKRGLLPPKQQGLENETTELISGALSPAGAAKSAMLGIGAIGSIGAKQLSQLLRKGFKDEGSFRRVAAGSRGAEPAGIQQGNGASGLTESELGGIQGVIEDASLRGGRGSDVRSIEDARQEVRRLIANPDENPAVKIAREINPEFSTEFMRTMPPSSMLKQSPIASTVRQMTAEGGIDPDLQRAIFTQYLRKMPDVVKKSGATNYNELSEAAYQALGKETDNQLDAMLSNGMRLSYHKNGEGNYLNSDEMLMDALLNKHLYTFQGGDPHTFLNQMDPQLGINANEKFRAVHDYFGHGTTGSSFGPKGEELAYGAHSNLYSPLAKIAAATETRGQNSLVNYSGMNADLMKKMADLRLKRNDMLRRGEPIDEIENRLRELGSQWKYAPQTDFILPPEFLDTNFKGGMPDYVRPFIKPTDGVDAPGFHWSNETNLRVTDPAYHGKGLKGRESDRKHLPGWEDRSYFYNHPALREPGLGSNQYETELSGMYDGVKDPLRLHNNAKATLMNPTTGMVDDDLVKNVFESAVKDAGYQGYKVDNTSAVFYPQALRKRSK